MKIGGIEKFSLVDYPHKTCCVIFLHGCNFRCGFCHNPNLVIGKTNEIKEKEVLSFLEKRKGKLDSVCITGGEPLISLKKNFLKEIKKLGYKIKLDTNGSFPEKLKEIIKEDLVDYIAMDIKGPKELYEKITGTKINIKNIEESIKIISKFPNSEFRITIIESIHTEDQIKKMVDWVSETINKNNKKIYLQLFRKNIEHIDRKFKNEKNTSESYLKKLEKINPILKSR